MKKITRGLFVFILALTAAVLCAVSAGAIVIRTTDSDGNTTVREYDSIEEYVNDVGGIENVPGYLREILVEAGFIEAEATTKKAEPTTKKAEATTERPYIDEEATTSEPKEDPTEPYTEPYTEPTTEPYTEPTTEPTTEPEPEVERTGDVNGDGKITSSDARLALRISVGLTLCPESIYYYADADGNRKVEAADARALLRVAVKLDDKKTLSEYYYWSWNDDYPEVKRLDPVELYENGKYTVPYDILVKSGEKLKWTSTVPSVATVDANGKIKAVSKGYTCVYASAGNAKYCINVNVLNSLQKKIYALQAKYPAGYYWNKNKKSEKYPAVSEIPCPGHPKDYSTCLGQCAGFGLLLSNEVFGSKAPFYYNVTAKTVKIGDCLRIKPSHTVFVTDVIRKGTIIGYDPYENENIKAENDMVTVADCNWHWCCDIGWGRQLTLSDSSIIANQSYSRYK